MDMLDILVGLFVSDVHPVRCRSLASDFHISTAGLPLLRL